MTVYVLHQGCATNQFYSLFARPPRVTHRFVKSEVDGSQIPLFETPDSFAFNFCLYGTEKRLKFKLPLGSYARLTLTVEEIVAFQEPTCR